jgi:hypothetical protein
MTAHLRQPSSQRSEGVFLRFADDLPMVGSALPRMLDRAPSAIPARRVCPGDASPASGPSETLSMLSLPAETLLKPADAVAARGCPRPRGHVGPAILHAPAPQTGSARRRPGVRVRLASHRWRSPRRSSALFWRASFRRELCWSVAPPCRSSLRKLLLLVWNPGLFALGPRGVGASEGGKTRSDLHWAGVGGASLHAEPYLQSA